MARRRRKIPEPKPYTRADGKVWTRLRIDGVAHYPGPWGSEQAKRECDRLIGEWLLSNRGATTSTPTEVTVARILAAFDTEVVQRRMVRDGKRTADNYHFASVIGLVARVGGTLLADEFSPDHLEQVRTLAVEAGWSRTYINRQARRVVGIFRWARRRRWVSADAVADLADLPPLREGDTPAPEVPVKEPPPDAVVDATIRHLAPVLAAMVQVQRLSGMRPGETCRLRLDQLHTDADPDCWLYEPLAHKTRWRGKRRRIWLGPRARAVLVPWVERARQTGNPASWVFPVAQYRRRGTGAYSPWTYEQAVRLAALKAHAETCAECREAHAGNDQHWVNARARAACFTRVRWSPGLLRSSRLTEVGRVHGPLEAQATGGHSRLDVTSIYMRQQDELAKAAARASG